MLPWLLQQWIRQTAQQKLMEAVAEAARRPAPEEPDPSSEEDAAPATPPPPCQVAIVCSSSFETAGLLAAHSHWDTTRNATFVEHVGRWQKKQVCIAEVGSGKKTPQAIADLLAVHQPQWVISAGFASALVDELPRGHLLMADEVCADDQPPLAVGFRIDEQVLAQTPKLHVGRLLTAKSIVAKRDERRMLAQKHNAVAYDLESYAVAEACRAAKTRFLSVRVITDDVESLISPAMEKLLRSPSFARQLGAAAGALFNRQGAMQELWQIREDALRYSDRLAKFLAGVVEQLH